MIIQVDETHISDACITQKLKLQYKNHYQNKKIIKMSFLAFLLFHNFFNPDETLNKYYYKSLSYATFSIIHFFSLYF